MCIVTFPGRAVVPDAKLRLDAVLSLSGPQEKDAFRCHNASCLNAAK
jgi:hypothetical protein